LRLSELVARWVAHAIEEYCPEREITYDVGLSALPDPSAEEGFVAFVVVALSLPSDTTHVVHDSMLLPCWGLAEAAVATEVRGLLTEMLAVEPERTT
jgi:hypothetical protein